MKKIDLGKLALNKKIVANLSNQIRGGAATGAVSACGELSGCGPCYPSYNCPPAQSKRTNICHI